MLEHVHDVAPEKEDAATLDDIEEMHCFNHEGMQYVLGEAGIGEKLRLFPIIS